jgi:hypothetical protein
VTAFVIVESIYFAVIGLVFVVLYATRSDWQLTWTGRNVMAFVGGVVALLVALLATLVWPVPTWVFAIVIGELCYAMTQRVWLLMRAQRKE